jgi:NNP family nitrate/nitrite transporter-like MFS transporter
MGVAASANSGTVLAVFFAPRLEQIVGWHGVFGLMILPILVTALLFALLVRGDVGVSRQEYRTHWWETIGEVLQRPSMYWLCFIYAITFGGFVGLSSFLPIFFHDQYRMDLVTAGSWAALCGLAGSLARPFGGYCADRLGGLKMLLGLFPVLAVLVVAIGWLPRQAWALPLMVTAVACMGFGNGVVFQVVSSRFQKQMGTASGLIGAAGGLGGFLLPSWLGLLKDTTGTYQTGFLLFAVLAMMATVSVAVVIRRNRLAGGGHANQAMSLVD